MAQRKSRAASGLAAVVVVFGLALRAPVGAQQARPAPGVRAELGAAPRAHPECTADLTIPGTMKDILSNALKRGLKVPRRDVVLFLDGAEQKYATGHELLKATAAHFRIAEDVLVSKVEKYRHCNCAHPVPSDLHPLLLVDPAPHPDCDGNLENTGELSDVLSNTLMLGFELPEPDVRGFLDGAGERYEDSPELFKATAAHFKIEEGVLAARASEFRHCNCEHAKKKGAAGADAGGRRFDTNLPPSKFAKDVTLHVVLHELGHAVIREFDIPVLANEETMADAFATYYLTTYMPERAVDVLTARVTSLMIEAGEEAGGVDWSGEHDHDARRANQIAALAVAADPVKYEPVADVVKMSAEDIEDAVDYGGELRRSWRRVLAPLWMPEGAASSEAKVAYDDASVFLIRLCEDGLSREIESALRRFDWHSQVTIRFVEGDGKAGWSRSARTVTVHSAYVRRFVAQGARGLPAEAK